MTTCADCKHFTADGQRPPVGECRRFPPAHVAITADGLVNTYPRIAAYLDPCGEFQGRTAIHPEHKLAPGPETGPAAKRSRPR